MTYQPPAPPIPQPANHPRTCRICRGTGWEPGPDITRGSNRYTTVQPCTHHWTGDDPDEELVPLSRAQAAFAAGYAEALAAQERTPDA